MNFCPLCANVLLILKDSQGYKLNCRTCVYYYPLFKQIKATKDIASKKQAEIVTSSIDQPIGEMDCPKCGHQKAYYQMMQTRSADEQSTIIYCCVSCSNKWSVDR